MQMQRRSFEASSDTSYCGQETWEDWGSRSSLSQVEEVASSSRGGAEDLSSLRAERDALSRALAAERARAAGAARAHDARLAELHGVIAELVRRRASDHRAAAIPEEELSDDCESSTQPAGELDDADLSRTEQNESPSLLSPCELPAPRDHAALGGSGSGSGCGARIRLGGAGAGDEASLRLSDAGGDAGGETGGDAGGETGGDAGGETGGEGDRSSCERERGSDAPRVCSASPGRCESRQAKVAARVRLKRTEAADSDTLSNMLPSESPNMLSDDEGWCLAAAERLAREVGEQADLREALVAGRGGAGAVWRARCLRLQADCAVLQCALRRAADTAHRLYLACGCQESCAVRACLALRAADRALEAYDVLLALAESSAAPRSAERAAAELVAGRVLARLEGGAGGAGGAGSPLLSPGPWLQHTHEAGAAGPWDDDCEERLRGHAARLKADTVSLRPDTSPTLFSYHDVEPVAAPGAPPFSMADMEAAVAVQEALAAAEARAVAHAHSHAHAREPTAGTPTPTHESGGEAEECRGGVRRARHWLDTRASETDL